MNRNTFFLKPVAPFRLDLTVWTLRRRPHNLIDRWDGESPDALRGHDVKEVWGASQQQVRNVW